MHDGLRSNTEPVGLWWDCGGCQDPIIPSFRRSTGACFGIRLAKWMVDVRRLKWMEELSTSVSFSS